MTKDILIVDDEPTLRGILSMALEAPDRQIFEAAGVAEAKTILENHPMDVVISDYHMPRKNGADLLHHVCLNYPDTTRILMCGALDPDILIECVNNGKIYHVFSKPFSIQELRDVVDGALLQKQNNKWKALPCILIVDDEPNVLNALTRSLQNELYRTETRKSGMEALEYLRMNPVDLIISDQMMPEMNGVEFLIHSREMCPDAARIMLSAYSDFNAAFKAINQAGIVNFILKPWNDEQLRETIRSALDR